MTKEEYMKLAESKWSELEQLEHEKSFYEYEKMFEQIMLDLSRAILQSHLGSSSKDRRKKKVS